MKLPPKTKQQNSLQASSKEGLVLELVVPEGKTSDEQRSITVPENDKIMNEDSSCQKTLKVIEDFAYQGKYVCIK